MKRRLVCLLSLCLMLAASAAFVGRGHALGQEPQPAPRLRDLTKLNERKITMEFNETPIKDALKSLLKHVDINRMVIIDPASSGSLTFSVKDVPFEGALVSILRGSRHSNLQYRVAGDMLVIAPQGAYDQGNLRVAADVKDGDVAHVLGELLKALHANYTLSQFDRKPMSISFENLPLKDALQRILDSSSTPLSVTLENGTYRFEPKGR